MLHAIAKFLAGPIIALLTLAGYSPSALPTSEAPVLGSFTPAGGLTYRLKSSIGTTNSTIVLSSFKNRSGIPLTMSLLNTSIAYATLDPQTDNSEFISFTGITQNADGTATLSGVSRGLADIFPFTASTTMRMSHSGQSILILSDSPQLFEEYPVMRNTENITGSWGFAIAPYDYGNSTSSAQFATRAYANSLAVQGAATSTYTTSGIGLLATGLQAAQGTYKLTQPYFLSTAISTSTYFGGASYKVPITGASNTLDVNFMATSSVWNFTGANTHAGAEVFSGMSTTTFVASTTMAGLEVTGSVTGNIPRLLLATTTNVVILSQTNNSSTTIVSVNVPGGILYNSSGSNGAISVHLGVPMWSLYANATFSIDLIYGGNTLFTFATTTGGGYDYSGFGGFMDFYIIGNNSSSSQEGSFYASLGSGVVGGKAYSISTSTRGVSSTDSSSAKTLQVVARISAGASLYDFVVDNAIVKIER